jgi:hypothetical protein
VRRGAYRILMAKANRKRQLERPRSRWEDNIKIDLKKWDGGKHWIDLL